MPLRPLTLRAHIAVATRAARRLFPLLVGHSDVVDDCDKGIAAAEAFAAGEPGSYLRARELAERLTRDLKKDPLSSDTKVHAAYETAAHVARAAEYAFSAVALMPPALDYCKNAHHEADEALSTSLSALLLKILEPIARWLRSVGSWRRPWNIDRIFATAGQFLLSLGATNKALTELERLFAAIKHDWDKLATAGFQTKQENELGPPVGAAKHGMLGALWKPKEDPDWYEKGLKAWRESREGHRAEVRIVSYCDFDPDKPAHFVCWDARSIPFEEIESDIGRVRKLSIDHKRPIPGLAVYAPEICETTRVALVRAGAIVDTGLLTPFMADRSVPEALGAWLDEANENWWRSETGSWLYVGSDATWRLPERERLSGPPRRDRGEPPPDRVPPPERPAPATNEEYAKALAFLLTGSDSPGGSNPWDGQARRCGG